MRTKVKTFILVPMLGLSILSFTSCQRSSHDDHDHGHGTEEHSEEQVRGQHGGRLLEKGSFSLELKIFETGVPPQYRIYAYNDGKSISPEDFTAEVLLERLGGRVDHFSFVPVQDFLTSEKEVEEPHSFDVNVKAKFKGEEYSWRFESYEGRTTISDKVASISGLQSEKAESREIKTISRVRGKILPSEHRIAHVIPRFSGVVRESKKHIGDKVEKGEVIAVIESNQSLQPFEVRSQISGTVINGHVIVGEFVPENQWIYVVADLSEVWADFFVPLREQLDIKIGQKLHITSVSGEKSVEGTISYVAPYADERSQSQLVRVVIPNPDNQFLPGMFVLGDLVVSVHKAPVVVKQSAIQTFRDWQVVFAKYNDIYEIKPVELGKADGEWIEVLNGLSAGEEYVSENAFLIKADILKSGASHDH